MAFRLTPLDGRVHDLVATSAGLVEDACRELSYALGADLSGRTAAHRALSEVLATSDSVTEELVGRIASSFVTPLDHRDLHAIARGLHTTTERLVAAGELAQLHAVESVPPGLLDLVTVVSLMADLTDDGLPRLRADGALLAYAAEVQRLGVRAGAVHRRLVADRLGDERTKVRVGLKVLSIADEVLAAAAALRAVATVAEGAAVTGS